jgi:hypothetical protein
MLLKDDLLGLEVEWSIDLLLWIFLEKKKVKSSACSLVLPVVKPSAKASIYRKQETLALQ